jgi:hypothetical protein
MVCVSSAPHHPTDAYHTCGHHHHGGRLHSHFGHGHGHGHGPPSADCAHSHHGCEPATPCAPPDAAPTYAFVGHGAAAANKRRHPRHAHGHVGAGTCGVPPPHHHDVCGNKHRHAGHRDAHGHLTVGHAAPCAPHPHPHPHDVTFDHCPGSTLYAPHVPHGATLVPPGMPGYAPKYVSRRCEKCSRCRAHDELDYYCGTSHVKRTKLSGWKCGDQYEARFRGY